MQITETHTHTFDAVVANHDMLEIVAHAVAKQAGISLLRADVTWTAHADPLADIIVSITIDHNKSGDADARQSQMDA